MKPFTVIMFASSIIHLSTQSFIFPTEENIRNLRRLRNNFKNNKTITSTTTTEKSVLNSTSNDTILNEIEDTHLKTVLPKSYCKNNSTSCSDPSYYPTKLIQRAIYKQGKELRHMFDSSFPTSRADENERPEIQARTGLVQEWKNLCDVSTTFTKPRLAQNKDGESLYIVNFDSDDKAGMGR